jgi:Protein of unknown function (DUF2934)
MSMTQEDREDRVRRRAYLLWQDAGGRDGEELRFWLEAEDLEAAEEAKGGHPNGESFPAD